MYYTNGNFTIYYEKYGTGKKTVLILPGWGFTRPTFQTIINYLSKDFTVYIIDYPGFGNSSINKSDLTIYDYADAIKELMQNLDIINPIIIAHSFGGRISTIISGYYKEPIEKLILIDVAGIKPRKTLYSLYRIYSYKIKKRLIKLLPKNKQFKARQKLFKKYASSDYYDLPDNMKKTFQNIVNEDLTKYIKGIDAETLIIWGEKDQATPLKDAYKFKRKIKGSGLVVLKGATHFSYLDYSFLTINILQNFLNSKK